LADYESIKWLHNQKLELKGNIRVFCRVRPVLPAEREGKTAKNVLGQKNSKALPKLTVAATSKSGDREEANVGDVYSFRGKKTIVVDCPPQQAGASSKQLYSKQHMAAEVKAFKYDRVFKDTDSQENVFEEVSEVV
jgi:hypothetical protein